MNLISPPSSNEKKKKEKKTDEADHNDVMSQLAVSSVSKLSPEEGPGLQMSVNNLTFILLSFER